MNCVNCKKAVATKKLKHDNNTTIYDNCDQCASFYFGLGSGWKDVTHQFQNLYQSQTTTSSPNANSLQVGDKIEFLVDSPFSIPTIKKGFVTEVSAFVDSFNFWFKDPYQYHYVGYLSDLGTVFKLHTPVPQNPGAPTPVSKSVFQVGDKIEMIATSPFGNYTLGEIFEIIKVDNNLQRIDVQNHIRNLTFNFSGKDVYFKLCNTSATQASLPPIKIGDQVKMLVDFNYFKKGDVGTVVDNINDLTISFLNGTLSCNFSEEGSLFERYSTYKATVNNSGYNTYTGNSFTFTLPLGYTMEGDKIKINLSEPKGPKCECGAHAVGSNSHQHYCGLYNSGVNA